MLLTRNAAIFCDILGFYLLCTFVYANHKELLKKLLAFLSVILMWEEIEGGKAGGRGIHACGACLLPHGWGLVCGLPFLRSFLISFRSTALHITWTLIPLIPLPPTPYYCYSNLTRDKYQAVLSLWVDGGLHFYPMSACWVRRGASTLAVHLVEGDWSLQDGETSGWARRELLTSRRGISWICGWFSPQHVARRLLGEQGLFCRVPGCCCCSCPPRWLCWKGWVVPLQCVGLAADAVCFPGSAKPATSLII